jgi:hypothetical protein
MRIKYLSKFSIAIFVALTLFFAGVKLKEIVNSKSINKEDKIQTNSSEDNVIFIESNSTRKYFRLRDLCSIESAAKNNPTSEILVFSINAVMSNLFLLEKYKNIRFKQLNLSQLFQNTVMHEFWFQNKISKAQAPYYREAHLGDALRLHLLHKYGGFYSDLDTITLKDLSVLKLNGASYIYERNGDLGIANGMLRFKKNHPFLLQCLENFAKNYNGERWTNGPQIIYEELLKYCNIKDKDKKRLILNSKQNYCDVGLYPDYYFYPMTWYNFDFFFKNASPSEIQRFKKSFSIHYFGAALYFEGKQIVLNRNDSSMFQYFASENCPLTLSKFTYPFFLMDS